MKTDVNGVSQCQKGCENYETFTHRRKKFYQYEYRAEDGELFTCVKPTLSECRKARDEHFKPVTVVYTPAEFKEKGFDGEIAKYMREHTNTAIVGDGRRTNGCIIRVRNKKTPDVINQYAPGEFYTVTESDIWLMRYCKGRLKIRLSNAPRKNDFRNKDIFLENR